MLIDDELYPNIWTEYTKDDFKKVVIGKGINLRANMLENLRVLKNTFNIFTLDKLPWKLRKDNEVGMRNTARLYKTWARREFRTHEHSIAMPYLSGLSYTVEMLASFLIEECYNFEVPVNATETEKKKKRTHEEAFGEIDGDLIRAKLYNI